MEIGKKQVHGLKPVAGRDKDIRLSSKGGKKTIFSCRSFKCAEGSGSYRHDASAAAAQFVQFFCGFLRKDTFLRVHFMIFGILRFHRQERARSHVEREENAMDARLRECGQELWPLGPRQHHAF